VLADQKFLIEIQIMDILLCHFCTQIGLWLLSF